MPAFIRDPTSLGFKIILSVLQLYFLTFNFTIEQSYCQAPITKNSTGILVKETYDFCVDNNPYFLTRPEWLRQATCLHANVFWFLYVSVLFGIWNEALWHMLRPVIFLFLGAKIYCINFYHYMEFTSELPPPNPVLYFLAEGPYLVAMVMVLYKLIVLDEVKHKSKRE